MRDIEDSPEVTRREWAEQNIYGLLNDVYHRILFYGQRDLFDPVLAYEMSWPVAAKLVECGYVRHSAVSSISGIGR